MKEIIYCLAETNVNIVYSWYKFLCQVPDLIFGGPI